MLINARETAFGLAVTVASAKVVIRDCRSASPNRIPHRQILSRQHGQSIPIPPETALSPVPQLLAHPKTKEDSKHRPGGRICR